VKKIVLGGLVILAIAGGLIVWQLQTKRAPLPTVETALATDTQPESSNINPRVKIDLKERLKAIKAKAAAFKQVAEAAAQKPIEEDPYQPDEMKQTIEAGLKLDKLIAEGNRNEQAEAEHRRTIEDVLTKSGKAEVTLSEVSCIKPFCRAALALSNPGALDVFAEGQKALAWPWLSRPHLMITENTAPIQAAADVRPGPQTALEAKVYFSSTAAPLPVDKSLQQISKQPL
jgi:hypothetical protein